MEMRAQPFEERINRNQAKYPEQNHNRSEYHVSPFHHEGITIIRHFTPFSVR
jgi:hypothetical protein